jgi:hypothetical protein
MCRSRQVKAATTSPDEDSSAHAGGKEPPYDIPSWQHFLGGLVHRHRRFWLGLGRLESSLLARETEPIPLRMPIYVCGLARSGSTLLHEIVSSSPCVATHRIKDYPLVFTPYWWRRATANLRPQAPRERPHRDGVMITTESPDAVEEMLWVAFFPRCHDPSVSSLMGAEESHPAFESFYTAHIRKLLLAEGATRYAAKANYHVARLPYLVRLFPDAKFLLPIRSPVGHIASLMRQHQWFSAWHRKHPRALAFMRRSGHFEFGLDRRPMHLGDGERIQRIVDAWAAGEEVRGLARYWDMVYGYLARLLASDAGVRAATRVVRFETICDAPGETLRAVLEHCLLPDAERLVEQHAPGIRYPTYYQSPFSPHDLDVIREETAATASLWGY